MKRILLSITTTSKSNWREKIEEIDKLGLQEMALFPTRLDKTGRQEMYKLLAKTNLKRIPFVHLRNDFDEEEINWLIKNYQTKVFNTHAESLYPLKFSWDKYKKEFIFLENTHLGLPKEELKEYAGVCIDFSHLENMRLLFPEEYTQTMQIIKENKIGCAHLSAVKLETWPDKDYPGMQHHDYHHLDKMSEMDYLKNYPQEYFPEFMAIELENSLEEQLKIKDYIENTLKILN